jgi:hypothetical protein
MRLAPVGKPVGKAAARILRAIEHEKREVIEGRLLGLLDLGSCGRWMRCSTALWCASRRLARLGPAA